MKMLKLVDGDVRLTATVEDRPDLQVGNRIKLKEDDEHDWMIMAVFNVPLPKRGWKNNI